MESSPKKKNFSDGKEYRVNGTEGGERLDHYLARLLPDMGIRGRRRVLHEGRILLNGRHARAGSAVKDGDILTLKESKSVFLCKSAQHVPELLFQDGRFCFFSKPAGLNSVRLAGGSGDSLEDALPLLLGGALPVGFSLLQRLDCGTSGIVCAAVNEESKLFFRQEEKEGRVCKRYACIVEGILSQRITVQQVLATSGGKSVRVQSGTTGDPARWTHIEPLCVLDGGVVDRKYVGKPVSLAGCVIYRGQRHQIRAHAASTGHPLLGDILYGAGALSCQERFYFYLHHAELCFSGYRVFCPSPWILPENAEQCLKEWFADMD